MTRPLLSTGFSIQEVATAKGVSTRTVRRWLTHGLPFVQPVPHGRIFVREQDLEEFLRPRPQQHAAQTIDHLMNEILGEIQENAGRGARTPRAKQNLEGDNKHAHCSGTANGVQLP
jgi:hypothetical protein